MGEATPGVAPSLAARLNQNPLSLQPHRVVRASGGSPGSPGPVSLHVVVSPAMATAGLEQLVRDLREQYLDADVFSMQVHDSEKASTYDRHSDGGALDALHLVARAVRDRALGIDTIQIRGNAIEP